MSAKTFEEWWDSDSKFDDDTVGKGGVRACCVKAWNASRAALLADAPDVEGLVGECRNASVHSSNAHKIIANAKSARNQAAGDEGANYAWLTPEQTLEGRCAAALESLAAQNAAQDEEIIRLAAHAASLRKYIETDAFECPTAVADYDRDYPEES